VIMRCRSRVTCVTWAAALAAAARGSYPDPAAGYRGPTGRPERTR